jgi:sugar/nucleoside kinase (ribokinase family)
MDASMGASAGAAGQRSPEGRDLDLLVLGEVNPDIIVRAADPRPIFGQVERWVDGIEMVLGSSSVIAACGAARLGLRVAIAGVVGDDAFGRFMLTAMAERGIDTSAVRVDRRVPTGATVILASATDRAILTAAGTIPLLRAADVPERLIARARHVHAGSFFLLDALRPELPALFRAVRVGGGTTSVDTNWDPSGSWDARGLLAETDVFLPNDAEAIRIALAAGVDARDAEGAARALLGLGPRVVAVKLGREGALAVAADGRVARCPALAVEPVDATGAGDSFDAGFLAGWLGGRSLEACLALGVACGSLSTRAAGGTAAQPTLPEAEAAARVAGLLR